MSYYVEYDHSDQDEEWFDEEIENSESEQEDAIGWLGGAIGRPRQEPTRRRSATDIDDDELRAGIQSVMQIVPMVVQALQNQPESRKAFEALTGLDLLSTEPEDKEAWPAVIGAVVSALPSVINAVSGLVSRRKGSRRPPPPRAVPAQQPAVHCAPKPDQETLYANEDAEAIQLAALIPVLLQLLPVVVPMIVQLLPMLAKSLPTILNSFSKLSKMGGSDAKKEDIGQYQYGDDQGASSEASDPLHELSNEQISSIWKDTRENDFPTNPETVAPMEDDFSTEFTEQ